MKSQRVFNHMKKKHVVLMILLSHEIYCASLYPKLVKS